MMAFFLDERCAGLYPATCTYCENMTWYGIDAHAPLKPSEIKCLKGHLPILKTMTLSAWRKLMRMAANCPDFEEAEDD